MKDFHEEEPKQPGTDDAQLIFRFKQGNERAFDELVKRNMERAVQLAYVTIGNYEDAKDVSQEAFVKAHRALRDFQMKSSFSTWFYRILMNTAKDFLRKRKWQKFVKWETGESMENFFEQVPGRSVLPGEELVSRELGQKMSEAIKKLPFKQQWIFTLRFLEGQSLAEIAAVTQLSEGTVKASLHFAVQKFKQGILPYVEKGGETR